MDRNRVCRPIGNRKHRLLLFLSAFIDVKRVFDCRLSGMFIILHLICALLDVVPFSNYEKTTPVKRTITATAGIQNEKSGIWVHK